MGDIILANADPMISGNWITTFVVAVIGAVGALMAKRSGKAEGIREATQHVTLQSPVPEVPVRKIPMHVSWNDHSSLAERVGRLEGHIDVLRKEQADQFKDLLEAASAREVRIMDKIDLVAREWHGRMDAQFGPKPRGGAARS